MTTLPPLSTLRNLSRVNLQQRLLNMLIGRGAYPEPLAFQVTTARRLLDKALDAWNATREKLADHISGGPPRPTQLSEPSVSTDAGWDQRVSQDLFRAIDRLEDVVDSLARFLRLLAAIESHATLQQVPAPKLSLALRDHVRIFRNRVAHDDADLAEGKAGKGLSTATLATGPTGIEIQGVRLAYAELEVVLVESHDYLQRVIALV